MHQGTKAVLKAYDAALAAGDIKETDKVLLTFGSGAINETVQRRFDYLANALKEAVVGTPLEGKLEMGQKVVVVEDLISTGGSVIEVVNVLREAGAEVLGIVSIFTYGMKKGIERLAAADVKNVSLTCFDVIAEIAAEENYIKKEDVARLIAFRNNPSDESWIKA